MAEKYAGIRLELSGALGKRTKFQVFDTALLQLQVSHARGIEDASSSIDETSSIHVPQTSMDTPPIDKLSLPRVCVHVHYVVSMCNEGMYFCLRMFY